ncbi:hypothetical protein JCM17823_20940 [Halorubrum gandharaense]
MSVQSPNTFDDVQANDQSTTTYDLLLASIPVPLAVGGGAATLGIVSEPVGVGLGAVPAALLTLYALFVAAPKTPSVSAA